MPRFEDYREHIGSLIEAVRLACDPRVLTEAAMRGSEVCGRPAGIIAVGKAAGAMLAAAEDLVGQPYEFVAVEPVGTARPRMYTADHPLPTERNIEAASRVLAAAREWADPRGRFDSIVVLVSGGASALLTLPDGPLTLMDVRAVTAELLRAGAPIEDLNAVRKHIERLKGGRLAALCAPIALRVFALSDVRGDRLDVIGSGPCSPDPSTFADAVGVIDKYGARHASEAVARFLEEGARGERPETPKPGDRVFGRVSHSVVGNNHTAIRAAEAALTGLGFPILSRLSDVQGEAADAGRQLAAWANSDRRRPAAAVLGGETTVEVGPAAGRGGRNLEAALAGAIDLAGTPGAVIATLATDGVDGPTDAAGAVVTGSTVDDGRALGMSASEYLARHDSYTFFETLDKAGIRHLIRTGPTGTNVNDIAVALRY
jgi:hydroxypyruvate reductase